MTQKVRITAVLAGMFMAVIAGLGSAAELTAYAYVELTKETMELKVEHLNQLIGEISSFSGDSEAWISTEAQLSAAFDVEYETVYANYGVSAEEFLLFYSANEADVESYLDAHPEDRSHIADVEAQISAALGEFERQKIDLLQLAPVVPEESLPPGV